MATKIGDFLEWSESPGHDYQASLLNFPSIDVAKLASDLELENRGRDRGTENLPPVQANELDLVELSAVHAIEEEVKRSFEQYTGQIETVFDRLRSLDFDSLITKVRAGVRGSLADFEKESRLGLDELSALKSRILKTARYLVEFEKKNNIGRPAFDSPSFGAGWGIIITIASAEVIANASLMGEAYSTGFGGAAVVALVLSLLNIGTGVAGGFFGWRFLQHRKFAHKAWGAVITVVHLLFVAGLNLFVGLMRDALQKEGDINENISLVWQLTLNLNVDFQGFEAPLMMLLGGSASLITAYKGFKLDDPYPAYGMLQRKLDSETKDYAALKVSISEQLENMRDEVVAEMNEAASDLGKRRHQYFSINATLKKIISRFELHLEELDSSVNRLLAIYRASNVHNRKGNGPKYFQTAFSLVRPTVNLVDINDRFSNSDVDGVLQECRTLLNYGIESVNSAYEAAFRQFAQIDDLTEPGDEQIQPEILKDNGAVTDNLGAGEEPQLESAGEPEEAAKIHTQSELAEASDTEELDIDIPTEK